MEKKERKCMKCGRVAKNGESLNSNWDGSYIVCDDCMWGIEKDGTRLADEFYSLAPRYRTKVKLQEMIDKWLDKAREEGYKKGYIDGQIEKINKPKPVVSEFDKTSYLN